MAGGTVVGGDANWAPSLHQLLPTGASRSLPPTPSFTMRRAAWVIARSAESLARQAGGAAASATAHPAVQLLTETSMRAAAGEASHCVAAPSLPPSSCGRSCRHVACLPPLTPVPPPCVAPAAAFNHTPARWSHCSCSGDLSLPPPQKVRRRRRPALARCHRVCLCWLAACSNQC